MVNLRCFLILLLTMVNLLINLSCASAPPKGTFVSRTDYDKIIVGKTSYSEMITLFGSAQSETDVKLTQALIDTHYLSSACGKIGASAKWVTYNYSIESFGVLTIQLKNILFNSKNIVCYKEEKVIKD